MESIHCSFTRLSDISVDELLHAYGVYVIWSGKSRARPSYIGEGDIWSRLAQHRKRFPRPIDGYAAIIGDYTATTKRDAQIIEAVLLEIAESTDRNAKHNKQKGKFAGLEDLLDRNGVVKVHFKGLDPLGEPGTGLPIKGKRTVSITLNDEGELELDHPWRLRRLRKYQDSNWW